MKSSRLILAGAALLAVGACDDDPPPPGGNEPVRVYVRDAATGRPVAGVKIAVMDPHANEPLAAPRVSDASGLCDFSPLRGVFPEVLVFGGAAWREFGAPGTIGFKTWDGEESADPTAVKTPPVAPPPLARVIAIPPPGPTRISGSVVDAGTGKPLAGVFVGLGRGPGAYAGVTTPGDDVTTADGTFSVAAIPFVGDVQAEPLQFARAGYVPQLWTAPVIAGAGLAGIDGVTISLVRDDGTATGSLRGRVVMQGEPVPYVTVGLSLADAGDKAAVGLPGRTAACGFDGAFAFTGLPAGSYRVHAGFRRGDYVFHPEPESAPPLAVAPDALTDAGDVVVVREIEVWQPFDGAVVDRGQRRFSWAPVAGAAYYSLQLDRGAPVQPAAAAWSLAAGDTLLPGPHVWTVVAHGADDAVVGATGVQVEFLVVE